MRRIALALILLSTAGLIASCDDSVTTANPKDLAPPLGLRSVTEDAAVTLIWEASNYDEGRQGFQVYRATGTESGTPQEIRRLSEARRWSSS